MKISKAKIALISIFVGLFLTLLKGIAGILTNSLGLLSEALHSFLDLGAAFFAYISIKIASKPADEKHTFGHGKAENLSALFQSLLLFATSIWIIYEAFQRIFFKKVEIEVNFFAFLVISISIISAFLVSRLLKKGAEFYQSQALEADGLHYTSDIYSSLVVFFGLIGTKIGFPEFDGIASIFVAVLILFATYRLSARAISDLMDTYPAELKEEISNSLKSFENIKEIEKMRLRKSGPTIFAELTLKTNPFISVSESHDLSKEIEEKLKEKFKEIDVIIHFHPSEEKEKIQEKVQLISKKYEKIENLHKIYLFKNEDTKKFTLCFHVVLSKGQNLEDAHKILDDFEREIKDKIPEIEEIHSHIEEKRDTFEGKIEKIPEEILEKIEKNLKENENILGIHDFYIYGEKSTETVSCHILLKKEISMQEAHKIATFTEEIIKKHLKNIKNVIVHTEPSA